MARAGVVASRGNGDGIRIGGVGGCRSVRGLHVRREQARLLGARAAIPATISGVGCHRNLTLATPSSRNPRAPNVSGAVEPSVLAASSAPQVGAVLLRLVPAVLTRHRRRLSDRICEPSCAAAAAQAAFRKVGSSCVGDGGIEQRNRRGPADAREGCGERMRVFQNLRQRLPDELVVPDIGAGGESAAADAGVGVICKAGGSCDERGSIDWMVVHDGEGGVPQTDHTHVSQRGEQLNPRRCPPRAAAEL